MNLREAAELAIEALQSSGSVFNGEGDTCGGCAWCYAPSYRPCEPHCDKDRAVKALRAALAEDAMQRLTDVQQEMDCYGDGNVYRGQRSSDSKTPTLTINGMPAVEGPLSKAHRTCQESRQVEPVAYVIGYSKGRFIIEAVEPAWLLPVGMALYRSPPTISKTETVEPVAYRLSETDIYDFAGWLTTRPGVLEIGTSKEAGPMAEAVGEYIRMFSERFAAPPKRKPLTIGQLFDLYAEHAKCQQEDWLVSGWLAFAAAIERAHGIGDEE